jgi:hypothetical protein
MLEPDNRRARGLLLQRRPWLLDLAVVGLPLALLYAATAAHDLGTIDSGELATVCARLGIAHPTGYPLYTLLGRIAVVLHPSSPIEAVNALSAVAAWLCAIATASVMRILAGAVTRAPDLWSRWVAPWAAGLWFGIDRELWRQATGNEVYSLHLLAVAGLLGLLIVIGHGRSGIRPLLGLGYLAGLAFAHHLSTAFLLPAIVAGALLWVWDAKLSRRALMWLAAAVGLAFLAWSVNLYLPIRSSRDPVLDWGDPQTWARFWRHYLAAQYRVWQFQSTADFGLNAREYLLSLPARVGWPVLALAIAGLWGIRRHLRIAVLLLLVWLVTFVWASGYSIHDLAPYYLPADLILVFLSGIGLAALGALLASRRVQARGGNMAITAGLAALTAWSASARWDEVDRSDDRFVRAHAARVLDSLPPNAILLSAFWDAVVSPSIYLQEIEHQRRDVTVVDPELLRRSWYYPQLRRWDARLLAPVESTVEAFLQDLALFEADRPYDPARIEQNYRAVIRGIAIGSGGRPVLFTPDVTPTFTTPAETVPEALAFAAAAGGAREVAVPDLDSLLGAGFRPSDPIHLLAVLQWRSMAENRARYLEHFGRAVDAEPWRALVRAIDARVPGAVHAGPSR